MKKIIALVTIGTICLFIGLNMMFKPPKPVTRDSANVSIQENYGEKKSEDKVIDSNFEKSNYKIKNIYSDKVVNNAELLLAEGKYSLISIDDFAKAFFVDVKENGETIIIDDKVFFILGEKKVYANEAQKNGEKLIATYKIPYPATKINGKVYLPLRTAARILGYGVRFDDDKGYVYIDRSISVDDANLIFEGYKSI